MINFSYRVRLYQPDCTLLHIDVQSANPGRTGKGCGARFRRVGPEQPIDLDGEDCKNSAVSLRQFKVQCSRVQRHTEFPRFVNSRNESSISRAGSYAEIGEF